MSVGEISRVMVGGSSVSDNFYVGKWGCRVNDYQIEENGVVTAIDFETLVVRLSTSRAATIEGEIDPVSQIVQKRNEYLERLGNALAELSKAQASFDADAKGTDSTGESVKFSDDTVKVVNELASDRALFTGTSGSYKITKMNCEEAVQLIKTKMDKLNNDSQNDMTRLQSLVDKRDESFTNASSMMQSISDCRSSAIKNMQ